MSFEHLSPEDVANLKIDVWMIEKVLTSQSLFINIPNYVNGKSTNVNINLINASLAIVLRGFLTFN